MLYLKIGDSKSLFINNKHLTMLNRNRSLRALSELELTVPCSLHILGST